jgi:hypothetical protein
MPKITTVTLPAGKYIIRVHIATYRQSWRQTVNGIRGPRVVPAHWREVCLKSGRTNRNNLCSLKPPYTSLATKQSAY